MKELGMTIIKYSTVAVLCVVLACPSVFAVDKKATLDIKDHTATVSKNGVVILRVPLTSTHKPKDAGTRGDIPEEDRASLVANCLIISRGVNYLPGTDAQGIGKTIEIHTLNGKHRTYKTPDLKGLQFQSYSFDGPSSDWGVILQEDCGAEGDMCSYIFLKSDGSFQRITFSSKALTINPDENGELKSRPGPHGELILPFFGGGAAGRPTKALIVHADGTNEIKGL